MRLIDADLLTTEIIKISGVIPNFNEDVALCSVDSMPTVRAVPLAEFTCVQKQLILCNAQLLEAKEKMKSMVPVVRCRDCEHLVNATVNTNGFLICGVSDMEVAPEDFCSHGERRKSNENYT
nr:MAG TPA: hypothetical protein [Caudoviricetes sp.]